MLKRIAASFMFVLMCVCGASAHPGGLDKNGGHSDRRNGGYHFHKGPLEGRSFSSREEAMQALRAEGVTPVEPAKKESGKRKPKEGKPKDNARQNQPAEQQKSGGEADYQRGMKHMSEGDYEAAEKAFRKAAEQGHEGAKKALRDF